MKLDAKEKQGCAALLAKVLIAINKPFADKAAAAKQKQLEDFKFMALSACVTIKNANFSASKWKALYYAAMKKLAAQLQELADEAEAAGNHELAELLRNNPLQKAIDSTPNFEEVIANPPGEKGFPVPENYKYGDNLPVPNEPPPNVIPPGKENDPEYAEKVKYNENYFKEPTWDRTTDPIFNAANELQDTICTIGDAELPLVEPKPITPAVALAAAVVLVGICACLGYVTFVSPRLVDTFGLGGTPQRLVTDAPTESTSGGAPTEPVRAGVGGCFAACDPAAPQCDTGLTCQPRADGTSICYSDLACGSQSTDQPTETVGGDPALPQSGCECRGTTLVCADGTIAEFNPACTGGSGGSCPVNCTCVPDGSQTGGHCQENAACGCKP